MKKEHVYTILILLVFAGACAATYQLYFKERLEQYAENQSYLERVQTKLNQLSQTFGNTKPEVVVDAWQSEVQPWAAAVAQRTGFFRMDRANEINPVPEGVIPRFHYEQQYTEMMLELNNALMQRQPPAYLGAVNFGVPDDLTGMSPTKEQVEAMLRRLRRMINVIRMLIDANAITINDVQLWPPRVEYEVLEMHTVGLSFMMRLNDLAAFLEELRLSDRYFSVNAIRIQNTNLMVPDPPLMVELLLTEARYVSGEEGDNSAIASVPRGAAPAQAS